ncbi:MAG: hypothetical protein Athens041674_682 [Parcubacteria group bacterium Athens0416_74]|nr:MAG: hypothetical protein Athens041674_682 [Parcubacteria group bacterium Athens0416_74]
MNTFKGLLSRWWFWAIAVIVILPAVWFLSGYIPFKYRMWQVENYRDMAKADYAEMQQEQEALEAAYRKDTYGGKTPEETLELFIEALEAKDYELAAKYFVIEKQDVAKSDLTALGETGNITTYLKILASQRVFSRYEDGEKAEVEFYDASGSQIHIEFFLLNPYTQKWKILE